MGAYTPPSYFEDLAKNFTPLEAREIVIIAAWQAAGLRAIASWRRADSLDSPLPLAYPEMREGEDTFQAYKLGPEAKADPVLAQELYDRYVPEWELIAGPPAEWGAYLMEAPNAFWGWAEFHRLTMVDGLNEPRVKAGVLAYLSALEGHETWTANITRRPELWGLTAEHIDALAGCDISGFDDYMRAVLSYVEEMTYSSGVTDDTIRGIRAVLRPGQLVELGMFAGLHIASIRIDLARRGAAH